MPPAMPPARARRPTLVALALAATAVAAAGRRAAAQPSEPRIRPGDSVVAVLGAGATRLPDGRPARVYELATDPGARYSVHLSARTPGLDPLVRVLRAVGRITEAVVEDDDGGDDRDALARFTAADRGPYFVVATTATATDTATGAVALVVRRIVPAPTTPRRVRVGETAAGRFAEESAVLPGTERAYQLFTFAAARGQRVRAIPSDSSVAVQLEFGRLRDGQFVAQPELQDSARAGEFAAPDDGEFALRVSATEPGDLGPYDVLLRPRASLAGSWPRPVRLGAALVGEVTPDTTDAGARDWVLRARRGERYVVNLGSSDFDPVLLVGAYAAGKFVVERRDDDGGEGNGSRVSLVPAVDREYVLRPAAYLGSNGEYTLRVTASPAPVGTASAIAAGAAVRGTLPAAGAGEDDDAIYRDYLYRARAGERLRVRLTSPASGQRLEVGRYDRGEFVAERTSDNVTAPDRSVSVQIPATGDREYVLRVARRPGQRREGPSRGAAPFTLRLTTRPPGAHRVEQGEIGVGERREGTLSASDAELDDGSAYDEWTLPRVPAGERLVITMRSAGADAIDTFLSVGQRENGAFVEFANDDDARDDDPAATPPVRVSRVVVVAPPGGAQFVVRANTFGPDQHGQYELSVASEPRAAAAGPTRPREGPGR